MAFLLSVAIQHSWIVLEISKTTAKIVPAIIAIIAIAAIAIVAANSVQLGIILYLKVIMVAMIAAAAMLDLSTAIVTSATIHLSSSASRIVSRK